MNVVLQVTKTEDWLAFYNTDDYIEHSLSDMGWLIGQEEEMQPFFDRLKEWEKHLTPSFFYLRDRMKKIAVKNWSKISNCKVEYEKNGRKKR